MEDILCWYKRIDFKFIFFFGGRRYCFVYSKEVIMFIKIYFIIIVWVEYRGRESRKLLGC